MESLAIHMVGTNRLYFIEVEHVLDRKSLSTFPEHALALTESVNALFTEAIDAFDWAKAGVTSVEEI